MRRFSIAICIFYIFHSNSFAQTVTFSEHIAPIIYKNCTPCHRKGEVGPFPFENYEEIKKNAKLIKYVVENKIMPPWKADTEYRKFLHERTLTSEQIKLVTDWIQTDCLEGEKQRKYITKTRDFDLGKPDLVIKLSKPVRLEPTNEDKFITYIQPIELKELKFLKAIEIVPQNKKVVHHCRVDFDTTQKYVQKLDQYGFANTFDLEDISFPTYQFVGDYVPGISPYVYPPFLGYKLAPKLYILINLHYSPVSKEEFDQSEVRLYFYKDTLNKRTIKHTAITLGIKDVGSKNLFLTADSISCFSLKSKPYEKDMSLLCIQPHMHIFGKSMSVYALNDETNDTIRLCRINNWDFKWQTNYYFEHPVKIPKGYILQAEACYDNTTNNPYNIYYPPRNIEFLGGMKTTNEMFEFYIQEFEYRQGDENLSVDY